MVGFWRPGSRGVRIPVEVRRAVRAGADSGQLQRVIAAEFGVSRMSVSRLVNQADPMLTRECCRSSRFLSAQERETISRELRAGASCSAIATMLGRHRSSVTREVAANGGREAYRVVDADARACRLAERPKATKLEQHPLLAATVTAWMENEQWSPEQISARLRIEFPDDETMRVAKETIYQELFVYGRGGLKKELVKHLRTQRPKRTPRAVTARNTAGPIPDKVMIAERPSEIEDRTVPGHWEGDLIIGEHNGSQIGTLVERTTGFTLLIKLPDRRASTVAVALAAQITTLPVQACKTITWDQGSEMAAHASFTIATDIAVYFCDPHKPWQRGSNENTNGLLRQYFPKGTDLSVHDQAHLDYIATKLNNRPRKRLDFMTPSEAFNQLMLR
jgi:transposase, IS30 family